MSGEVLEITALQMTAEIVYSPTSALIFSQVEVCQVISRILG
jgi:hypothetical protein